MIYGRFDTGDGSGGGGGGGGIWREDENGVLKSL